MTSLSRSPKGRHALRGQTLKARLAVGVGLARPRAFTGRDVTAMCHALSVTLAGKRVICGLGHRPCRRGGWVLLLRVLLLGVLLLRILLLGILLLRVLLLGILLLRILLRGIGLRRSLWFRFTSAATHGERAAERRYRDQRHDQPTHRVRARRVANWLTWDRGRAQTHGTTHIATLSVFDANDNRKTVGPRLRAPRADASLTARDRNRA